MAAGGIGATVGNPTDLILIRMQADSLLPEAKRRNYSSFFNAAKRIPAEEGLLALWTGTQPTIARAMAVNVG
jgi:solute carrier family 25 (mitochondrial oxoglutarate transporter), member 11